MKKLFLILFSLSCLTAWATTPEEVPNPHITDTTLFVANPDGVLSKAAAAAINDVSLKLRNYYADGPRVEVVVVAVQTIGWSDLLEWGVQLFNSWGIGDKERNTGVLIALAEEERDFRIITGEGVEGLLTDAQCSVIFENVKPFLADDNYDEGMLQATRQVAQALTTEEAQAELLLGLHRKKATTQPWSSFSGFTLIGLLIYLFMWLSKPKCPKCRKRECGRTSEVLVAATTTSEGQGIYHYTCKHCGHKWEKLYTIPKKTDINTGAGIGGGVVGGIGGGRMGGGFSGGSFGGGHTFGGGGGGRF